MQTILSLLLACFFAGTVRPLQNKPAMPVQFTSADTTKPLYKPYYSASFEMGKPEHSDIVLHFWKNWDNNEMDKSYLFLADTVEFTLPDGTKLKGHKKGVWDGIKAFRNTYSKVESNVGAWIPFRSTDKGDYWVAIWGTEYHTDKKGVRDSIDLHEIWRFNKEDKIIFMSQYDALFNLKQKGRPR